MTDVAAAPGVERSTRVRWAWWVALGLVMVGGLVLRTWNLDFDDRQHLHPDERHWSLTSASLAAAPAPDRHGTLAGPVLDWLDGQRSPANAYRATDSFVYGGVTLAAGRATASWLHQGAVTGDQPAAALVDALNAVGVPLLDAAGAPRFDAAYQVDLIGRLVGALVDTLTIGVVALIGRRVAGPGAGIAAAVLAALSVLAIQHAHFFGSEPWLGLVSALTVWATLAMDRGGGRRAALVSGGWAGVAAGAVLAVKLSGAGLAVVPVLVAGALLVTRRRLTDGLRLAAVLVGALVAFRVLNPAAFDGLGLGVNAQFLEDQRRAQASAMADLPPALQWADRPFLLTPLQFLVGYTVGPGTALAALAGTIALLRRRFDRAAGWITVAAWVVPCLFVVRGPVTSSRYFVPAMPALHVAAGVGVAALLSVGVSAASSTGLRRFARLAARPAAVVLVALAALWGLAFVNGVYGDDHTRIAASRWIAGNVPAGSVLTIEAWDDGLPLSIDGIDSTVYESVELHVVAPDSLEKIETLAEQLQTVDVVIESSPRVWGVVPRIPARFPSSIEFFEALDDGTLGFERAATFTSPPELGPFRLSEAGAEEAFSVYDHPEVRIWQRQRVVGPADVVARLDPIAAARAMPVGPAVASANGTMLLDDEVAAAAELAPYDEQFDTDANPWVHAAVWFVILELLGLAAFVLFLPLLRRLPDAGLGAAKLLGVAVVAFGAFAMTTWAGVALTRTSVLGLMAAWVIAGAALGWRRRDELRELWERRRTVLLVAELVGLVSFLALLALRAANPDIWHPWRGGEKPLELTLLTSVMRARTLPPPDPWFAGGAVNYYYGGYLMLSVPARVLRTSPTLALNLAPAFLAMTSAAAAYTAAAALRVVRPGPRPEIAAPRSARAWRAGVIGVAFVLLVPNVATLSSAANRLLGREDGVFDWWAVSRVIPNVPSPSEFPAWSMLFSDVHPHVFGLAIMAVLLAVVVAWWDAVAAAARPGLVVGLGAVAGFVIGLARAVNTWDVPLAIVTVGLGVVGMVITSRHRGRVIAASAAAAVAMVVVAWAPYARRTEVTDAGFSGAAHQVPIGSWAQQFGLFAVISVVATAVALLAWWRDRVPRRRVLVTVGATVGVVALAVAARAVGDATAAISIVLAAGAALGGLAAARRTQAGVPPLGLAVMAMGWLTLVTIEIVHVANDYTLNTIFKGWFEAWLLLALGAGAAIDAVAFRPSRSSGTWWRALDLRVAARVALVVAVLGAVAFIQLGVPARLSDRISSDGPSLDGLAFLDVLVIPGTERDVVPGEDRPLIEWLQANVTGLPTIAEAPGIEYQWTSRIATHTGLPTLAGWPWHGTQQRRNYGEVLRGRLVDLTELYTSGDDRIITSVLQRHRIGYVVYGTAERLLSDTMARRELLNHPCLDIVVRNGDLWVAEVDPTCVDRQPGALPVRPNAD